MKRIYLIDCPGVVYGSNNDTETDIVLKGVIRIENLEHAEEHVKVVLERVREEYIQRTYNIKKWTDHEDFLTQLALKGGRLLKGGEADIGTVSKMVLSDWIRGRLPFYTLPDRNLPVAEQVDILDVFFVCLIVEVWKENLC